MILEPTIDDSYGVRPTFVEVDLDAISDNLAAIVAHVAPASVMPILKANAYGHGLVRIARHLETLGVREVGVAYLEEAVLLRRKGVAMDILVLGGLAASQTAAFIELGLTMTASSVSKIQRIDAVARAGGNTARVHLKIDTGMGRIGVSHRTAASLFEAATAAESVRVEAVYSHFACADEADLTSAHRQVDRFNEALAYYPERGLEMPRRHMANSGGIIQLPEAHFETVRPGILMYGIQPSADVPRIVPVRPALSWHSEVVYFKVLPEAESVSYGSTWTADGPTRLVTVPVGYGDGYFRLLSNRGEVVINGARHPIRGRVCMDQFMVDIGQSSAYNGDEVVLIGGDGAFISVEDIATWADTIPYEVLTNINTRVPRVYRQA